MFSVSDFTILKTALFFSPFIMEREREKNRATALVKDNLGKLNNITESFKAKYILTQKEEIGNYNDTIITISSLFGTAKTFIMRGVSAGVSQLFGGQRSGVNATTTDGAFSTGIDGSVEKSPSAGGAVGESV